VSRIAISVRWKFCNTGHCRFSRAADVWCVVYYTSVQRYDMPAGHFDT